MRLYSTLSRRLEELPPPPGPIRMYVCGSTVYQRIHVGNSRPFVLGMWVRSWLRSRGYEVTLVHNITDVDDKVYVEAAKLGKGSRALADEATEWFIEDTDELGLGRPDVEPRASQTITEIVEFIEALIANDLAYVAQGDVYFRVARYSDYGELSGARLDDMIAQEPNPLKEDPRDFALWKSQKPAEDAGWDSPWGPGRPGWHIECSAMAEKHIGPEFEIHGGGLDLRFPHHENELAQSRSRGYGFAHVWMHNGMLEIDAEKMSKSVGNVVTLRDVLDRWGRETLLLFHMTAHWRKPVDFNDQTLEQARAQVESLRNAFVEGGDGGGNWEELAEALEDDFNLPDALAVMHAWRSAGALEPLSRALGIFGLGSLTERESAPADVVELAQQRLEARGRGDFAAADQLRRQIEELGWEVRDGGPEGFQLVPKR